MPDALVTCIMPTADRPGHAARAIDCFVRQDYPHRELVIIDDGDSPIEFLCERKDNIRYFHQTEKISLATKRNSAIMRAYGNFICHWDDDDFSAPWRLSYQMESLELLNADLVGLHQLLLLDKDGNKAFSAQSNLRRALWPATWLYKKQVWEQHAFAERKHTDAEFLRHVKNLQPLADNTFYVADLHKGNTGTKLVGGRHWDEIDFNVVRGLASV